MPVINGKDMTCAQARIERFGVDIQPNPQDEQGYFIHLPVLDASQEAIDFSDFQGKRLALFLHNDQADPITIKFPASDACMEISHHPNFAPVIKVIDLDGSKLKPDGYVADAAIPNNKLNHKFKFVEPNHQDDGYVVCRHMALVSILERQSSLVEKKSWKVGVLKHIQNMIDWHDGKIKTDDPESLLAFYGQEGMEAVITELACRSDEVFVAMSNEQVNLLLKNFVVEMENLLKKTPHQKLDSNFFVISLIKGSNAESHAVHLNLRAKLDHDHLRIKLNVYDPNDSTNFKAVEFSSVEELFASLNPEVIFPSLAALGHDTLKFIPIPDGFLTSLSVDSGKPNTEYYGPAESGGYVLLATADKDDSEKFYKTIA